MNLKKFPAIVAPVVLVSSGLLLSSCERHTVEWGSKKPMIGAPVYGVEEQVALTSRVSHIEEIAPILAGDGVLDGAALYIKSCGACHQPTGAGLPAVFPPLDKSPYVVGDNVERLASIMLYGLVGPVNVLGTTYSSAMMGLGAQFNDQELAAIGTHVRASWSNKAGPVEAKLFADMRAKWGSRGPFTIQELGEEK